MSRSTRSSRDVVPSMVSRKAAFHTSQNPSSEMARTNARNDIPISAWELVLNDEGHPSPEKWPLLPVMRRQISNMRIFIQKAAAKKIKTSLHES